MKRGQLVLWGGWHCLGHVQVGSIRDVLEQRFVRAFTSHRLTIIPRSRGRIR